MEWYLDISDSVEYPVSLEREEGRDEGWIAALPIGELSGEVTVVTAMLADGMDLNVVIKYTKLSRTRLENIKRRISEKSQ
ncbi:hypothetical protein AB4Z50_33995 [Paenibacillus sp. 2TAB26]|uniref:hypothetical protein n=1 Tax=Paenibacillus sp. 2TAB26 TaxID=3233005 RepID=UPI003F980057